LAPLQTVALADGNSQLLSYLEQYAKNIDRIEAEALSLTPQNRLLRSCKAILGAAKDEDFIITTDLVSKLNALPDENWSTYRNGRAIDGLEVSKLLGKYGIRPSRHRIGEGKQHKGYFVKQLKPHFDSYVPKPSEESDDGEQPSHSISV
jgi:hypothetical protein